MQIRVSKFICLCLLLLGIASCMKTVKSFKQLGEYHCESFPVQDLWRLASGTISQKYGEQFYELDCYVRKFIRTDQMSIDNSDENNEDFNIATDPIVNQYSEGIRKCLPGEVDAQEATYQIWRLYRFLVQHDYIYEWIRAKVRATLGFESERPNAWMDGDNQVKKLQLNQMFSNEFYEYLDSTMVKDFLFPMLTFFKENTVIAMGASAGIGNKPLIFQSLSTKNFGEKVFATVILDLPESKNKIFAFTIPGIPLLLAGSSTEIAWSFTGILVDRTNVQKIQTHNMKYYDHDTEKWFKLKQSQIVIPGVSNKVCKFVHTSKGSLYSITNDDNKKDQYIMRWHENTNKVRLIFSDLYNLIQHNGQLQSESMEFPFNSIMFVNETGIFQYICQQAYPAYFLHDQALGEPEVVTERWFSYPSKKMVVVSNSHLTTTKQQQYQKGEPLSPLDQQIMAELRQKKQKFSPQSLFNFTNNLKLIPQLVRQKQSMLRIYRKVKFIYLPQEKDRKKCDRLISLVQKSPLSSPIFPLWNYYTKHFTFNYISNSPYTQFTNQHRLLTENYWAVQMKSWEDGVSYPECDSYEYDQMKLKVEGTSHNSSCYFAVIRALNFTAMVLDENSGREQEEWGRKRVWFMGENGGFRGTDLEEAFGVYYSQNLKFAAQIGNPNIVYSDSYLEKMEEINLSIKSRAEVEEQL